MSLSISIDEVINDSGDEIYSEPILNVMKNNDSDEENNDSGDDINDSGDDINDSDEENNDSGDDVLPISSLPEPIGFSITLVP